MFTRLLPPQLSFNISVRFATTSPPHLLLKPSNLSTISATSLDNYGPSLRKGFRPTTSSTLHNYSTPHNTLTSSSSLENDTELFDESIFTRIYDIAALRVPAEHCSALERRLRGHLLNWPRIRNIGRVHGDEMEEEFQNVLEKVKEEDALVTLNRRIYGKAEGDGERLSGVLYRDKLVKSFNSKGYLNFRNLAKLSRPTKRKKGEGINEKAPRRRGIGKNEMVLLEVVEDEGEEEDLSGLLGKEFEGGKWKGSTRLLLLDERYADKMIDEMPGAIKVSNAHLHGTLVSLAFGIGVLSYLKLQFS